MTTASVARIHPEVAVEAAGYIRVSSGRQKDNHSPEVQRAAISALAKQEGYVITLWEQDVERGRHTIKREGYQRLLDACRKRQVHAVFVFSTSRWGRRASERLLRGEELDLLGIPLYSVQQGKDTPGIKRVVFAGVDEEYPRQLAANVRPAKLDGAKKGTHQGPTPFGYRRVYPAWDGQGTRPPGDLVPDEATAWIVRDLFARYDAGGVSLGALARWMNDDPRVPPPLHAEKWSRERINRLLRNDTYKGVVGFGRRAQGFYERTSPEDAYSGPGRHEALVDTALWERVQRRLCETAPRPSRNRVGPRIHLGAGLFNCAGCGGPMRPHRQTPAPDSHGTYLCLHRQRGHNSCDAPGYRMDIAHAALLAEVRRLRGAPWTPQAEERLAVVAGRRVSERATLERALEQERAEMSRHVRGFTLAQSAYGGEPPAEVLAAFREESTRITARIRALEAQLRDVQPEVQRLDDLRALHTQLTTTELRHVVDGLEAAGDTVGLRELCLALVASAHLVERQPERHSRWVRLEVTWTDDMRTLLDAGLLWLDEAAPRPAYLQRLERNRLAQARYRQRQRQRVAQMLSA